MDLHTLNKAQRDAVTTTDGRLLILAGAGSGKTKVLTMRMGYLMKCKQVPPESILGLTFTNKAAEEMRCRLGALIGAQAAKKTMLSTFHSFCMYVLRREAKNLGYTADFTLYDRQDVMRLMSTIARDILEHEGALPSLTKTFEVIALAKNRGVHPADIKDTGSSWHDGFAQDVARRLNESLRAYNACDFDHLLWLVAELFDKRRDVLARYQARFRYVMIDEYQDTNPIQAKIATLLTEESKNLCVVGDDDQSIYSWRGANVNNILRFADEATKTIKLEQNYRSTNTILKAANSVIAKNNKRHKKTLWSEKGEGNLIEVFYAPNEMQEAEAIVLRLVKLKEKLNLRWSDFAILYRSNSLSRAIETALLRQRFLDEEKHYRGIPYVVYGGDEFYEHKEVKDLLAYLRVIANTRDHEALLRIVNYPRRGIGEDSLEHLILRHREEGILLWQVVCDEVHTPQNKVSERAKNGLKKFHELILWAKEEFATKPFEESMRALINRLDFQKAIFEEVKSEKMRKFKLENVETLISSLKAYEETSEKKSLSDFLGGAILDNDSKAWKKTQKDEDHVHLMTFHSSKGLEFPCCFLIGLEDHLIPHEKSIQAGDIEEERRLLYVAMTRAEQHLTLSMSSSRKRMASESASKPSRFLFEIPKELLYVTKYDVFTSA